MFFFKQKNHTCIAYPDHETLFEALKKGEDNAVRCLYQKTSSSIRALGRQFELPADAIDMLVVDCITLIVHKIQTNKYVFQGFDPAGYVIEIAKNKVREVYRQYRRHQTIPLETALEIPEKIDFTDNLAVEVLESLFNRLSPNCQNLIRLKYLEVRRDKEIIELKLTQYTTVDALKNHRAKCLKKLSDLLESQLKDHNGLF